MIPLIRLTLCALFATALLTAAGCGDKTGDAQAEKEKSKTRPAKRKTGGESFKTPAPGFENAPGGEESPNRPTPRRTAEKLKTFAATGTVTMDGADLPLGVTVLLVPETGDHLPQGRVAEDGSFELATYAPSNAAARGAPHPADGAPAGKYKVVLHLDPLAPTREIASEPEAGEDGGPPAPDELSQLGVEKPVRDSLGKYSSPDTSPLVLEVTDDADQNRFDLKLDAKEALPPLPSD